MPMKLIPTFKCKNMQESLEFYSKILGFEVDFMLTTSTGEKDFHYASLKKDQCELHLSTHAGDGVFGSVIYVQVEEVDNLFAQFVKNGLMIVGKKDSPVHIGPTDQTWGMREFYVDDPSGNTLRFGCVISGLSNP